MKKGKKATGEENGRAVLNSEIVWTLRKLYRENRRGRFNRRGNGDHGAWSTAAMAARQGTAQSTMWAALTGRTWGTSPGTGRTRRGDARAAGSARRAPTTRKGGPR